MLDDPVVQDVAKEVGMAPHALLLNWAYTQNIPSLCCSTNSLHIQDNLNAINGKLLPPHIMQTLEVMDRHQHFCWDPKDTL